MSDYPIVEVEHATADKYHVTVRRDEYLKQQFKLYEGEFNPLIEALENTE